MVYTNGTRSTEQVADKLVAATISPVISLEGGGGR